MSKDHLNGQVMLTFMILKQRLVELRKEQKLSQDDVAHAISVSKSQVSNWEQGKGNPSVENLIGLAKLFNVSTDYLLFDGVPREGREAINDLQLYEYFRKAESLPIEQKATVKDVVDGLLFREKVKGIPEAQTPKSQKSSLALQKIAGKRR
jgi:transcriptional regulator with XRE-family HTH domain